MGRVKLADVIHQVEGNYGVQMPARVPWPLSRWGTVLMEVKGCAELLMWAGRTSFEQRCIALMFLVFKGTSTSTCPSSAEANT